VSSWPAGRDGSRPVSPAAARALARHRFRRGASCRRDGPHRRRVLRADLEGRTA